MWGGMFNAKQDQFMEVKIEHSSVHGATWEFTDWSFTRKEEIMMPTVCNYGINYEGGKDGKSFSLISTGRKENDSFNVIRGEFVTNQ
jgi:hypothetical protein